MPAAFGSDRPLWQPTPERVRAANLTAFAAEFGTRLGRSLPDYAALHRLSIEEPERFWTAVRDFCGLIGEDWSSGPAIADKEKMPGARWFPEARINFAENLLAPGADGDDAIVFRGEKGERRRLTRGELRREVARLRAALARAGVTEGDRVAGYLPNLPETAIAMLASASLGAVWSSCSPDFGVAGVLDRFGQIAPKVLFAADGYFYGGKTLDNRAKVAEIAKRLPSVGHVVIVPHAGLGTDEKIPRATMWNDFLGPGEPAPPTYARGPFNRPLYILYSSGTTGAPKCIVHGAGGTLLQHAKEHRLHCDVKAGDRVFYFTTCGWMMWNWLVSALAAGATIVLYDGSPFHPDGNVLFDLARDERVTLFGTSAKFLDAARKAGIEPVRTHRLDALRTVTSTGSPLAPEGFDYVYQKIKSDMHLASIAGGTDLIGCFMLGNPTVPVWRGEIQGPGLGMAVAVFDESGRSLPADEKGELVCTRPFPSMPVGFWSDEGGRKYRAAYFERFPDVWCHGDWVAWTAHGGLVIYGRSDATLNPGGVRIGTAEIYRQVETLDEVVESLVVGQDWEGDVRVVLFVVLRYGHALDDALRDRIKARIRANCSPRHVPARIVAVADIPRTKSGKITELAVRDVIHGRPVKNREALANPEALDLYRDLPELRA